MFVCGFTKQNIKWLTFISYVLVAAVEPKLNTACAQVFEVSIITENEYKLDWKFYVRNNKMQ